MINFQICTQKKTILSVEDIIALIGDKCDGVIGQVVYTIKNVILIARNIIFFVKFHGFFFCLFQLTEDWGETLFSALSRAGGKAFSNMAVGFNNVDVNAASKYGVAVGNTPVSLNLTVFDFRSLL